MKTLTKFVYTMMTVGAISGSAFATGINSTNGNGSNSVAMAQNAPVSGIVKDSNGDPITGATVMVKGTNVGVTTDIDGHFSINAKIGSTLEIRFVGCKPQNVKVRNDKALSITLEENSELLDEVVVTAMGISREAKSLSYARQSIDPESFTETRGTNLTDMLTGKSAGMQVVSGGGPTASTRIVLRGVNSITGNNQPLFVVDGVPIVNNMGEDGDLDFGNPANAISPDEIENIEVLKGANASALYGSDAANGVILITTKKGKESKGIGVDYGFNMMFGHLYNYPTYQNIYGAGQGTLFDRTGQWNRYGASGNGLAYNPDLPYGAWYPNMAGQNHRSWGMPMLGFTIIGRNDEPKVYEPHPETTKSMYQTSTMITNSVSVNRKFDKGSFVFSYTGLISDDILKYTNKMNRHTFNARTVANLTKWLDMDVSTRYVYEKVDKRAYRNASNRNPVYMFAQLPRDASLNELIPWKHEDGTPFNFKEFTNPFWSLHETDNGDNKNWWMGNVTLTIKPFKFLRVRLRAATDLQNSEGWGFTNLYTPYDNDGEYNRWKRSWRNTNFDALVTFNKNFKNNLFSVNASVGASSQDIHGTRLYSKADQLLFSDFKSLSNAASSVSTVEDWESKKKQAVYGSASLGYDGWAYLDLTARNEWSSTLPKDNNSYFYWSAGSGIILSKLFKLDPHIFPLVKIRGSYAQVGNDTGFDRLVSGYYKDGTYYTFMGIPYFIGDTTLKNLGLKPEQTRSWELGAEVRLFDDRFSVDFTYYDKATRDQIVEADAPAASGYYKQMINAGKMTNKGVELSLKVNPIRTRDWDWTVQFNWSKNKNMVVELAPGIDRFELASGNEIKSYAQVGKPFGVFYGNDYKRDENGNICVQMDGRANYLPDQYLGSIQPDWLGGASTTLRWKDFVFSGSIDFQKGGKLWSYTAREGATNGNTVQTLQGRYEYEVSKLIYGENDNERKGMLEPSHTNMPNANYAANHVLYGDIDRVKGVIVPGTVYDSNVDYWAGQPCMAWVTPEVHWCHNGASSAARYIYDASYVKLRELSIGYVVPRRYLMRTFLTAVKVSAVGRNVAILYQNTPKGMDPQATSTTGNAQGFERGFTLPQATWGFDIKVSF